MGAARYRAERSKLVAFCAGWREQIALDVRAGIDPDYCVAALRKYQSRLAALRAKRQAERV
jgi:hypothetical protein